MLKGASGAAHTSYPKYSGIHHSPFTIHHSVYPAHGVSFTEAVTVLDDDFALTREDPDGVGEQRLVTLGMSYLGNLFVVVYTYREPDTIRLISAWKANKKQEVQYEKTRR